jgi:hypothetical protein
MRTLIIILGGFVLWAASLGAARLLGRSTRTATIVFVAIWCAIAAGNLWVGVSRAGYSFQEELPIFLLIFLLPSSVALLVKWKFL